MVLEKGRHTQVGELRDVALEKSPEHISWSDKLSNAEVLRCVGVERSIVNIINRRQRAWMGHKLRHGDLLPQVFEGRVEGRRLPGRPRINRQNK